MNAEKKTLFGLLGTQQGQTYREFAVAYRSTGNQLFEATRDVAFKEAGISEVTWQRWRSGATAIPRHPAPRILERMFPGYSIQALLAPANDEQVAALTLAPVLDESELRMTAREARNHATNAAAQILPDLSLDQLEDDLVRLVRAHTNTPPHIIYGQAKEVLGLATVMLDRTQLPSQRQRLLLVAGESSALLGGCAFDLGSLPTAVELFRAAALYGQVAEHGPLQAYAYGYLAILSYWGGNPRQAVQHVQRAQQFTGVGATGRARLAAIAARAFAHLGRVEETQQAIERSLQDRSLDRDEIHDGIGGEFGFSFERVAMSNSASYLLLRDGAGAESSARLSLDLIAQAPDGSTPFAVAPQASTDLAMALLLRRDLDAAAEALRPVLSLPREWRGSGVVDRINAVRQELVAPTFRTAFAASSLAERIEDFTLVAAPRILGPGAVRAAIDGPAS
ncbi:hypothetical protein E6W39_29090 [Kitasatospora acidiphila]|uniref:Tetratricopeptide repeat protein n=1 Tax=Kitasatospora acidiphila TaxID=2567942 RepID=A0A540W961_9ACTN|nr:hypothetical protein [Kitasatospora acidiphila]TQF05543.1 hypothetical protein E6W39_29090 [Kitasatospora acidiphila]